MAKVLVVYYSSTGNTQAMAEAVANGVKEAGGEVDLYSVSDVASLDLDAYDAYGLGCSAMGDEVLEEAEFEPFFNGLLPKLGDKKVILFGSYGWGDGLWMRNWTEVCNQNGVNIAHDFVIANDAPDEEALNNCKELGKALV